MAKITPLFQNLDQDMKEYQNKLFRHRAKQGLAVLVCAVVVLGGFLGIRTWNKNKTYETYEVVSSVKRSDALDTRYEEYHGKLLKYSRDGISCVNLKNEASWSQTYNMQTPILDVCQHAVAVADYQGNEAYIFGAEGLETEISTLLPIQQISVSSQGVVALLLNDSSTSWIYLYDKEGNKLVEAQCRLEETGLPLSIALSADGTKLAAAYLQVQNGTIGTCMIFYNFGSVGGNFVDKIVASKLYEDTVIPRVEYLGDSVCAAVSDTGIIYYEGKEIPEETKQVPVEQEIQSIFFGEKAVGLVLDGGEKGSRYQVCVYDTEGRMTLDKETNLAYTRIKLSGQELLLFSENECEIYNEKGTLRYTGSFDSSLSELCKGSAQRKYVFVFSDRTEEVRLR